MDRESKQENNEQPESKPGKEEAPIFGSIEDEFTVRPDGYKIGQNQKTADSFLPESSDREENENAGGIGEMPFLEHLEDLRTTLIRSGVALVLGCLVVMSFLKYFAGLLNWPLTFALGSMAEEGLITTSPMAVFSVILQVSFIGGFAIALPFILYFVSRFVAPGLNRRELSILKPGLTLAFFLFMLGTLFSFFVLVPASLKASVFFNSLFDFKVLWTADRYYGMVMWMTLGIGLSFEFPLVLVLLVYIGILSVEKLKKFRPYSIVAFLIVAAVITPTTDPFTFLLLAVPMFILYEAALQVSKRVERYKVKRDKEETAQLAG